MKRLALLLLFSFAGTAQAMVTFPDANTLRSSLEASGLNHLTKGTDLVETLGNRTLEPLEIVPIVEDRLSKYYISETSEGFYGTWMEEKPAVLDCILKDFPAAIAKLKNYNMYK